MDFKQNQTCLRRGTSYHTPWGQFVERLEPLAANSEICPGKKQPEWLGRFYINVIDWQLLYAMVNNALG